MTRLIAAAAAQRNIVLAPRACSAGSAPLDVEDLATGLLGELVAPVVEVVLVVPLDEGETGRSGVVGVVDPGVTVEVEGPGGGEEVEDGAGEDGGDAKVEDNGVVGDGVVAAGVEVGLGVAVVPDPPVIVNCGLALPESPNTSGEKAHAKSARHEVVASA